MLCPESHRGGSLPCTKVGGDSKWQPKWENLLPHSCEAPQTSILPPHYCRIEEIGGAGLYVLSFLLYQAYSYVKYKYGQRKFIMSVRRFGLTERYRSIPLKHICYTDFSTLLTLLKPKSHELPNHLGCCHTSLWEGLHECESNLLSSRALWDATGGSFVEDCTWIFVCYTKVDETYTHTVPLCSITINAQHKN